MSLDSITSALENFDLNSILPDLFDFLSSIQGLCSLLVMIGPIILLVMGLWYLFLPRKEVGKRSGFCTYFGMGSEAAWFFTQKMAGLVWGSLGLIMTIIMAIVSSGFADVEVQQAINSTIYCLQWQILVAVISQVIPRILPTIFYNRAGKRRKDKRSAPDNNAPQQAPTT